MTIRNASRRLHAEIAAPAPKLPEPILEVLWKISEYLRSLGREAESRFPDNLRSYSIPYHREDIIEQLQPDLRPSSVEYSRQRAQGWLDLAKTDLVPDSVVPKAARIKAMVYYSKALKQTADISEKLGKKLCAQANKVLGGTNIAKHLKFEGKRGSVFQEATHEGALYGTFKLRPDVRFRIQISREENSMGHTIPGTERMIRMKAWGKGFKKDLAIPLNASPKAAQALLDEFFNASGNAAKSTDNTLKQLKAKDRKLLPEEVELFAAMFTITNLGQELKKKVVGNELVTKMNGRDYKFDIQTRKQRGQAGYSIFSLFQQYVGSDGDVEPEYKSWIKQLKSYTLHSLAKTWDDMIPICVYFANTVTTAGRPR